MELIKKCLQYGINHFDTAEIYGLGEAEVALGQMLKEAGAEREEVVVATKVRTGQHPEINSMDTLNKKHIKEAVKGSLRRLGLDYVDLIYAHFFDETTPLEEVCRGFHEIVEEGFALYWSTSNWNAEHVFQAMEICERLNLNKPIAAQNEYNMLQREEIENEYETLFKKYKYGLVAWSPLLGGFLTGKHLNGISQDVNRLTEPTTFPSELLKQFFYTPYAQ